MKKTWFLAVLCCLFFAPTFVLAAGICGGNEITFQGFQDADDDEFMYTSYAAYTEANQKSCNGGCVLKKGKYYECDNEQGCAYNNTFFLTTEYSTFKGKQPGNMKLYKCANINSDEWSLQTLTPCTAIPTNYTDITNKIVNLDGRDVMIIHSNGRYCNLTGDALACFNAQKSDPKVYWQDNECKCKESGGVEYVWNSAQKKCVPYNSGKQPPANKCTQGSEQIKTQADCKNNETFECVEKDGVNCKCGKCNSMAQNRKTCREQRTTLKGKACCDTLSLGVYDNKLDDCICKDGMDFVVENGTGYCRPKKQSTPGAEYNCDATLLAQIATWKISCAKNADITALIQQIESYCAGKDKTETIFTTYYKALLGYNPQQCGTTSANITVDITAQINKVNNAYSQLTAIHNKFRDKKSVWKDADGNFNTARLASDSIAGVVLGTAGGLITSHVVKKNQVENGFEDIKCTIGGQNVAEWGDQFRVGIQ